nr:hypothetical protein [Neorhizobium tomejilense]
MTLRVSDAQNYDEVVCIIEADLTAFAPDVLVSGDRSTRAMRAKTGELIISGLPNDECSGAVINGAYVEYADK